MKAGTTSKVIPSAKGTRICHLSNKKYRLPNNMRRRQALSADGLRLIIWRDIIFFLCVSKSLVFLALFFGPMPLYVAEVPWYGSYTLLVMLAIDISFYIREILTNR